MSNIRQISLQEYLELFEEAQEQHKNNGEPIPELTKSSINNIEYILSTPFLNVFGKVVYWGFYKKASILFYLMIKNHPLANGNKRLACASLIYFYEINNRAFSLSEKELYNLSKSIANSESEKSEKVISEIKNYLKGKSS